MWNISQEYAQPNSQAELLLNFSAKDVYLVMETKGQESTVNIYVDEEFIKTVSVKETTLYTLVELESAGRHILRLEFTDDNTEVYAFTFG